MPGERIKKLLINNVAENNMINRQKNNIINNVVEKYKD